MPSIVRRLRSRLRRVLRRAGIGRSRERTPPALSVILPIYNVQAYLGECLTSILTQSYLNFEVLVVDDGSPDASYDIATTFAAEDPRVVIIRQANAGLGSARNTGLRAARGTFVTFVDSDDRLPRGAFASLMRSLRASRSDIAVGAIVRFSESGPCRTPEWVSALHDRARIGITLEEFPQLVRNNYTWNKVFRRRWWLAQDLWFREGVAYEDQPIITQLFTRAAAIDVLDTVVYEYRVRADNSSISQQVDTIGDLRARIAAWELSRTALSDAARVVRRAWLQTLFDAHFHWYLDSPSIQDSEYWSLLRDAIRDFTDDGPAEVWAATAPFRRVVIELARRDRPDLVLEFRRRGGRHLADFPTTTGTTGLTVALPFFGRPEVGLPDELYVLHPDQLELGHSLHQLSWLEPGVLRLIGWAYVRFLDLGGPDSPAAVSTQSTLHVVPRAGQGEQEVGRPHAVPNVPAAAPALPPPNDDANADYHRAPFCFDVDFGAILENGGIDQDGSDSPRVAPTRWALELEVRAAGFDLRAPLVYISQRGSAALLEPSVLPEGSLLTFSRRELRPLLVRHERLPLQLLDPVVHSRRIAGVLCADHHGEENRDENADAEDALASLVALQATTVDGETRVTAPLVKQDADRLGFVLELPSSGGEQFGPDDALLWWQLRAVDSDGRRLHVRWSGDDVTDSNPAGEGESIITVRSTRFGRFGVLERRSAILASVLRPVTGGWLVQGRPDGDVPRTFALVWHSSRARSTPIPVEVASDGFSAVVPTTRELGRFGTLPLPAATYRLVAEVVDGERVRTIPLTVPTELVRNLPDTGTAADGSPYALTRAAGNAVELQLVRPLDPAAQRRYGQRILQARTYPATAPVEPGVLLSSYFGESATDNGLGVQRELLRRGADLPMYWVVRDHSVPVPAGATPVIRGSSEWYRLLARCRYYLDNMYQPEFHDKPAGQVIIQTFHGYPFKTMGYPNWVRAGFSQRRIDSYLRRSAQWDYLVSPAPYASPLLRRDFRYEGEVLEIGYPRNDVLLDPGADELRDQVRGSLGLEPDQTAVLYAPTFRDYLSPDDHRAEMVDFLDLDALTAALGPSFVVLVRGHAFNARVDQRVAARRGLVEVTDYPEVSDLYLAADAAIVDYSSLRFDFGVTGKPMIFHVPDLARYVETRGWLFDFEPTAPGPLVATTAEVADALLGLSEVEQKYAEAHATFRQEFLTLEDGLASARLVDEVFVPRGDAPPRSS